MAGPLGSDDAAKVQGETETVKAPSNIRGQVRWRAQSRADVTETASRHWPARLLPLGIILIWGAGAAAAEQSPIRCPERPVETS